MKRQLIAAVIGGTLGFGIGLGGSYLAPARLPAKLSLPEDHPAPAFVAPSGGTEMTADDLLAMYQGKPLPGQGDDYSCAPAHKSPEDPTGLRSLLIPCDTPAG
jgi:hypothetical protein